MLTAQLTDARRAAGKVPPALSGTASDLVAPGRGCSGRHSFAIIRHCRSSRWSIISGKEFLAYSCKCGASAPDRHSCTSVGGRVPLPGGAPCQTPQPRNHRRNGRPRRHRPSRAPRAGHKIATALLSTVDGLSQTDLAMAPGAQGLSFSGSNATEGEAPTVRLAETDVCPKYLPRRLSLTS